MNLHEVHVLGLSSLLNLPFGRVIQGSDHLSPRVVPHAVTISSTVPPSGTVESHKQVCFHNALPSFMIINGMRETFLIGFAPSSFPDRMHVPTCYAFTRYRTEILFALSHTIISFRVFISFWCYFTSTSWRFYWLSWQQSIGSPLPFFSTGGIFCESYGLPFRANLVKRELESCVFHIQSYTVICSEWCLYESPPAARKPHCACAILCDKYIL